MRMKRMGRRKTALVTAAMVLAALLSGCGSASWQSDGQIHVVTTLFCYYDFAREIIGDTPGIQLKLLLSPGMESHSFEPTPSDIVAIQHADVFLYNGGHMESWVDQVLDAGGEPQREVVCMMDQVDALEEETTEGMEEHETQEHTHKGESDAHQQEIEYDEHIWTSPVIAQTLVQRTCDALCQADPAHAEQFQENTASYLESLRELDAEIRETVEHADTNLMIFGDKFPLLYFTQEYGLDYYAAFPGCSTDAEPSVSTISFLIEKCREASIPAVYYFEVSSDAVANVIAEESGAKVIQFQSCHSITQTDFDRGETYLSLMQRNITALKEGLYR